MPGNSNEEGAREDQPSTRGDEVGLRLSRPAGRTPASPGSDSTDVSLLASPVFREEGRDNAPVQETTPHKQATDPLLIPPQYQTFNPLYVRTPVFPLKQAPNPPDTKITHQTPQATDEGIIPNIPPREGRKTIQIVTGLSPAGNRVDQPEAGKKRKTKPKKDFTCSEKEKQLAACKGIILEQEDKNKELESTVQTLRLRIAATEDRTPSTVKFGAQALATDTAQEPHLCTQHLSSHGHAHCGMSTEVHFIKMRMELLELKLALSMDNHGTQVNCRCCKHVNKPPSPLSDTCPVFGGGNRLTGRKRRSRRRTKPADPPTLPPSTGIGPPPPQPTQQGQMTGNVWDNQQRQHSLLASLSHRSPTPNGPLTPTGPHLVQATMPAQYPPGCPPPSHLPLPLLQTGRPVQVIVPGPYRTASPVILPQTQEVRLPPPPPDHFQTCKTCQ